MYGYWDIFYASNNYTITYYPEILNMLLTYFLISNNHTQFKHKDTGIMKIFNIGTA